MKLILLFALCASALVHAATPQVSVHDCSCKEGCADTVVNSGGCVAGSVPGTSRRVSCLSGDSMCAQLLVHSGATCDAPFFAGQATICGNCTDAHGGYSVMRCNPETGDASLVTSCDSTCSFCNGNEYSYPYDTCSSHAAGLMAMYNQGLFHCDGVSVEEFNTADCTGPVQAAYARPSGDGCRVNNLTFSCLRPASPTLATPPAGDMVTYAKCPINSTRCGEECQSVSVRGGTCVENPTPSRSKYVEMSCGTTSSTCATFAVSTGETCAAVVGKERHACGTCSPWFGGNVYTKLDCDTEGNKIQVSLGCNADCSLCTTAVNESVETLGCFSRTSTSYSYSLNFQGFESCATVELKEFGDDSTCQVETARYPIVRDTCNLFYSATCGAEKSKAKLSGGAIAGIVIGCVAFVALVVAIVVVYYTFYRKPLKTAAEKKTSSVRTTNCPNE